MTMCAIGKRGCDAVIEGLRAEFGSVLAERILEAEAVDFLWESRVRERYLGQHFCMDFDRDEDAGELFRIAILSALDGRWHAGECLVDGEGSAVDLVWRRSFDRLDEAEAAFERAV